MEDLGPLGLYGIGSMRGSRGSFSALAGPGDRQFRPSCMRGIHPPRDCIDVYSPTKDSQTMAPKLQMSDLQVRTPSISRAISRSPKASPANEEPSSPPVETPLPPSPALTHSSVVSSPIPSPTAPSAMRSIGVQTSLAEQNAPPPQTFIFKFEHTFTQAAPPPPAPAAASASAPPWHQLAPPAADAGHMAWARYRAMQGLFTTAWALVSLLAAVNLPLIFNFGRSGRP